LAFISKIDLGSEPSLSGSRTVPPREKNGSNQRIRLWVGAGLALTLILAGAWSLRGGRDDQASSSGRQGHVRIVQPNADVTTQTQNSDAPIAVRYSDGTELPEPNLLEAIRKAEGKSGTEVILRNRKPLEYEARAPLEVDSNLVIRAAAGAKPIVTIGLSGKVPFLRTRSNASLTLRGLAFTVMIEDQREKTPPVLIEAADVLRLENCEFALSSSRAEDHDAHVAVSEGLQTTVSGCIFEGFDRPLVINAHPASVSRVTQCLFVRDQLNNDPRGWAVSISPRSSRNVEGNRSLAIDHCTIAAGGLLEVENFQAQTPLRVTVEETVVRATALVMASKESFPKGLKWTGRNNRFAISGASWAVVPPVGIGGEKDWPTDLKSWSQATSAEPNTTEAPLQFRGVDKPPWEEHRPEDFTPAGAKSGEGPGIDPDRVGLGHDANKN
jgi:hypothetical protein